MADPFSLDSLQKAVADALATPTTPIPPGHTTALVTMINGDKAELAVAKKINDVWQIEANVSHPWSGPAVEGGFIVHASW